jgi:hexosaminidase
MKFTFNPCGADRSMLSALELLGKRFGFGLGDGIGLEFIQTDDGRLTVDCDGEKLCISAPSRPAFFRGIGSYMLSGKREFHAVEEIQFRMNGMMFDHSRNGVLTVERTKDFLLQMAMMGMNTYLPYMEDVYELPGEPLFGYLRGRYSADELREIDDFADLLGIEVIPCIQTLAHLNQFLIWEQPAEKYKDIDNILLCESQDTLELIDKMFSTLSSCLRSRRIHVGMDEAYHLGRGRYLDRNGFTPKGEIMRRHLENVSRIAEKYGLSLMMWDDMFFRNYSDQADMSKQKPSSVTPVYWDYYRTDTAVYEQNLDLRLASDPDTVFAGGAWRWGGYTPHHSRTIAATNAALTACKNKGVRDVFVTSWGDDGDECPAEASLPGMVLFAEHGYNCNVDENKFADWLKFISGVDLEAWMMQERFDTFAQSDASDVMTPHKYALYGDPLCGTHDRHIEYLRRFNPTSEYERLEAFFRGKEQAEDDPYIKAGHAFYAALARVLRYKWDLGINLSAAYKSGDKAALEKIVADQIDPLFDAVDELRACVLTKWMQNYKLNGFEPLDLRLGGLKARLETAKLLVSRYVKGEIDEIAPLAEERALLSDSEVMRHCIYPSLATAAVISHN